MAYGRYSPKSISNSLTYSNASPNYYSMAYNDPMFALGAMLGNMFVNNYAQRGDNKVLDAAKESLNPEAAAEKERALNSILTNNGSYGLSDYPTMAGKPTISISGSPSQELPVPASINIRGNEQSQMPIVQDGASVIDIAGGQAKIPQEQIANLVAQKPLISPEEEAQQRAIIAGRANANPTISADGGEVISNALLGYAPKRMSFNKEKWLADQEASLMQQGIPAARREYLMQQLDKMATARDNEVKENNANITMGELKRLDSSSPEYLQRVIQLSKENPTAAAMYGKNVVNDVQKWTNSNLNKRQERTIQANKEARAQAHQYSREDRADFYKYNANLTQLRSQLASAKTQQELQQKIQMGRTAGYSDQEIAAALFGGKSRRTGSNASDEGQAQNGITKAMLETANKVIDEANKMGVDANGKPIPYPDQESLQRAYAIRKASLGIKNESANGETPDREINYEASVQHFSNTLNDMVEKGTLSKNGNDYVAIAYRYYGPQAKNILDNADWQAWGITPPTSTDRP